MYGLKFYNYYLFVKKVVISYSNICIMNIMYVFMFYRFICIIVGGNIIFICIINIIVLVRILRKIYICC